MLPARQGIQGALHYKKGVKASLTKRLDEAINAWEDQCIRRGRLRPLLPIPSVLVLTVGTGDAPD